MSTDTTDWKKDLPKLPPNLQCNAYIQLQPHFYSAYSHNPRGVRAVRMTQSKPDVVKENCVVVKVTFEVPVTLFDDIQAKALVEVLQQKEAVIVQAQAS